MGSNFPEVPAVIMARELWISDQGSALLEFAIVLPLLVVFVVGIYDFSGAFNEKQKIAQAAQEGALIAGAQPNSDIVTGNADPPSLRPVVNSVFKSLAGSGVLPNAGSACTPPPPVPTRPAPPGLAWVYTISNCSTSDPSDNLVVTIDRGWVCASGPSCASAPPVSVGTKVTVAYPYHWRFNSVIQLLIPGANYAALTQLTEAATVQNQI